MQNIPQIKFTLKIFFKNGKVKRIHTKKRQRISYFIQTAEKSEIEKFYICVSYGLMLDAFGNTVKVFNDGEYSTKQSLNYAIRCFAEGL